MAQKVGQELALDEAGQDLKKVAKALLDEGSKSTASEARGACGVWAASAVHETSALAVHPTWLRNACHRSVCARVQRAGRHGKALVMMVM